MSVEDDAPPAEPAPGLRRRALSAALARQGEFRHAVRVSVAVGVAFAISSLLRLPQGYWAVFTAVIVVQTSIGGTITASIERLVGTVVGGAVGVGAAYLRASTVLEEGFILSGSIAILAFAAAVRPSLRVAPITAAIVLVGGSTTHMDPLIAASWRVVEILIGSAVGLGATLLVFPARALKAVARTAGQTMAQLADLVALLADDLRGGEVDADVHAAHQSTRRSLAGVEQALKESARESASGLGDGGIPGDLLRSLWRVRNDCVMVGRALVQPLPPTVADHLAPFAAALLDAAAQDLRDDGAAVGARLAPPESRIAQPRAAFEDAVERMRQAKLTSEMTLDIAARVYGMVFALEDLVGNLADLREHALEISLRGAPQPAPAAAP